jgi:SAM-dependent methyltransferase
MTASASAPTVPNYDDVWNQAYGEMQDRGPVHLHMRRLLQRVLRPLEYRSVVDVGCGAGHNLPLLCAGRSLERVTGVDVSEEALSRARARSDADFRLLDIEQGKLDGTWDLVFSSLVLEHLPDDRAALRNMRAMCGRHLVVTTIAGDFERYRAWDEQMGHVRNYARGELERKLRDAGFAVREAIYWGRPFYTPVARTLQNRMTSEPEFTPAARALAWLMHKLYYLNSSRRGDVLIARAEPV